MNNVKSHCYKRLSGLFPRFAMGILLSATLLASADDVKVYRVPKQQPPTTTTGSPQLKYKTPDGWTATPGGQMRVASFAVTKDGKKVDVSVIPLAGSAGGEAANVNRWRGQVALGPLEGDELKKTAEAVKVG